VRDLPFLPANCVELEARALFVFLFGGSLGEVVLDVLLNLASEEQVFDEEVLIDGYFLEDLLDFRLVQELNL
jgi:hypothetical protein